MEKRPRAIDHYLDESEGMAGWEFANKPPLYGPEQLNEWQETAFLNASEWLRDKPLTLFQHIQEAGNNVDIVMLVTTDLLRAGLSENSHGLASNYTLWRTTIRSIIASRLKECD